MFGYSAPWLQGGQFQPPTQAPPPQAQSWDRTAGQRPPGPYDQMQAMGGASTMPAQGGGPPGGFQGPGGPIPGVAVGGGMGGPGAAEGAPPQFGVGGPMGGGMATPQMEQQAAMARRMAAPGLDQMNFAQGGAGGGAMGGAMLNGPGGGYGGVFQPPGGGQGARLPFDPNGGMRFGQPGGGQMPPGGQLNFGNPGDIQGKGQGQLGTANIGGAMNNGASTMPAHGGAPPRALPPRLQQAVASGAMSPEQAQRRDNMFQAGKLPGQQQPSGISKGSGGIMALQDAVSTQPAKGTKPPPGGGGGYNVGDLDTNGVQSMAKPGISKPAIGRRPIQGMAKPAIGQLGATQKPTPIMKGETTTSRPSASMETLNPQPSPISKLPGTPEPQKKMKPRPGGVQNRYAQ